MINLMPLFAVCGLGAWLATAAAHGGRRRPYEGSQYLVLLRARREDYTERGWLAIRAARVLFALLFTVLIAQILAAAWVTNRTT